MTLMLMVFITFLIFLVAYNTLGKDVMSPTFLLVAGYLLSFVSTLYNIKDWKVSIGFLTMTVFLLGMLSFFVGEYVVKRRTATARSQSMPIEIEYIDIDKWKYVVVVVSCTVILVLTYREVVRIANLNFASWGNLAYNFKANSMNILVIHSHNANRGDEAAVKAMVDELLIKYPGAKITISNNGFTPYPGMPENVIQIDRFPKLESRIAQLEFFIVLLFKGKFALTKEARKFIRALKEADVVLHAPGGPSIGDTYFKAEKLYLWRLNLIRRMGIPYIFYAPSMGPFNCASRNKLRKEVISGAERIILRDPISVKYVKDFLPGVEVEQALDSALQHDIDIDKNERKYNNYPELKNFIENHEKCIGITITDLKWHPVHKNEKIIEQIPTAFKAFITQKVKEGYGVIFIPQLYGNLNDTKVMNDYMLDSDTFMIDAFSEERDTYFQQYVIGKLYAVVGMRYHSNIFSAKMGIPFVSVSYEQKMKGFMQSIGLSEYCIDLNELSEKTLFAKFGQLEANHDAYKNRLKNIHSDMKQQAYKTTEIVVNFLQEKGVTNA